MEKFSKSEDQNGPALRGLPFAPGDLMAIRVTPAELARLFEVSRAAVSQWIKSGKISPPGVDGRIDPRQATRELLERSDPARLRVRVIRSALADYNQLRQRVADLEAELTAANERATAQTVAALAEERNGVADRLALFEEAITDRFASAQAAYEKGPDDLMAWLETLADSLFFDDEAP